MRVAFLGLGAIGWPMAERVAERYPLTVWNRTPSKAQEFAASHDCQAADTPARAAESADVILICFPTSHDVERLLDGPTGLLAGLRSGAMVLDCTSGDPEVSRRIAERLAGVGVSFADCPVSGGTDGARQGRLAVMVGGDPETFLRAKPILESFGDKVVHVGPVGAGDTLKAVNQALLAANILMLAEALPAMVKAGVTAAIGLEVLNASSGRSFVSETLVPARVLPGTWPRTFRLALMDKDVAIALTMIEQLGLEAPVLTAIREESRVARVELGEEADYLEPIRRRELRAGVEVRNV